MVSRKVIGRVWWDSRHPSPWMEFRNVTAYRKWSRDFRKLRPGTKTEFAPIGHWTPEAMLSKAQEEDQWSAGA